MTLIWFLIITLAGFISAIILSYVATKAFIWLRPPEIQQTEAFTATESHNRPEQPAPEIVKMQDTINELAIKLSRLEATLSERTSDRPLTTRGASRDKSTQRDAEPA